MEDQDQDQAQAVSVLPKLLERMAADPGFAGLPGSATTIKRIDDDDAAGARALVAAILRDAGLTAKLLRLANSSGRGMRNVSTVDQAINILGVNTVRSVAVSLPLLGTLGNPSQLKQLHAEMVAALFCGNLAAQVTRHNGGRFSAQEAQVCGLMQNLGRVLTDYYAYDEIEASRALQAEKNLAEDDAVAQSLGISFDQIGIAVAQAWNLPDSLQCSLAASMGKAPPKASASAQGWNETCALFARRITDILFRSPESRERMEVSHALNFFHQSLSLKNDEVLEWIKQALADTDEVLGDQSYPCNVEHARVQLRKASERVLDSISSQDSLAKSRGGDQKKPIDIIHQALRILHAEYEYDLSLLLLPEGGAAVVAISGVGRNASQVTPKFRCQGAKADLFRLVMAKKADMYVADTRSSSFSKLLPDWYPGVIGARSFHLSSLVHEGKFLGMLYGDYTEPHPANPKEKTEGNAKKWRDVIIGALLAGAHH